MFRLDTIPNGLALPVDLTLEELILKIKDTNQSPLFTVQKESHVASKKSKDQNIIKKCSTRMFHTKSLSQFPKSNFQCLGGRWGRSLEILKNLPLFNYLNSGLITLQKIIQM